ncbi:protein-glutamine gamma-glutamyltransferase [Bacillus sp. 1P06AnD]|uniref:protein-glutamine gamma-glutamyltransferase n=1 Tax=Bacillus sp. 1P06AnD TaxID=3132208 RepID=UPI0039A2E09C
MISINGIPYQQPNIWPIGSIEHTIFQQLIKDPSIHHYQTINDALFEIELRKNIILSARAMSRSNAEFETLEKSRGNPAYWQMTNRGGFQLKPGVWPSAAIRDIFSNSSLYAFECATAIIIIYYYAVLNTIGDALFNQLFPHLYLYSWHSSTELGVHTIDTDYFIAGDVIYFKNPDFDPNAAEWRGENTVLLEDGTFFGHGLEIGPADQIIQALNDKRKPGSTRSAYMKDAATRLSFNQLAHFSPSQNYPFYRTEHLILHHNKSSIPFKKYVFYLNQLYAQLNQQNPL